MLKTNAHQKKKLYECKRLSLERLSLIELQLIAKSRGIKGYKIMNEDDRFKRNFKKLKIKI